MTTNEKLPVSATSIALLPAPQEFSMFQTIARSAKASGLYGGDENKIFMVMLAARELGISPMLALNGGIWNIQGKIEISARLMNSMIRRAGHTMAIKSTSTECTIIGKRCDTGEEHPETFTWAMAEKAGLTKGNVWQKYPEDMLYNRCMSRIARRLFPDVIGTAYVEGEISEAKEAEKQLPVAQYEDITPSLINHDIKDLSAEDHEINALEGPKRHPRISDDQLKQLLEMEKNADADWKNNMKSYLKKNFGSEEYKDMLENTFTACMNSLKCHIEKRQKEQVAA